MSGGVFFSGVYPIGDTDINNLPAHPSRDQDQEHDAHPTTMQTIERASAFYQEKLGFSTLFFAGEFRRMC